MHISCLTIFSGRQAVEWPTSGIIDNDTIVPTGASSKLIYLCNINESKTKVESVANFLICHRRWFDGPALRLLAAQVPTHLNIAVWPILFLVRYKMVHTVNTISGPAAGKHMNFKLQGCLLLHLPAPAADHGCVPGLQVLVDHILMTSWRKPIYRHFWNYRQLIEIVKLFSWAIGVHNIEALTNFSLH